MLDHSSLFVLEQPAAHVGFARALAMRSDAAGARKAYERFFEFWKRADADVPMLVQARLPSPRLGLAGGVARHQSVVGCTVLGARAEAASWHR